jgi:amidase
LIEPAETMTLDGRIPDHRCHEIGPQSAPVAHVRPGDDIRLITLDASGGQVAAIGGSPADFDKARIAPLTGPVAVEGVAAGDAIGLEILDVTPTARDGYMWTRSSLGQPRDPEYLQSGVRKIPLGDLAIDWLGAFPITIPRHEHVGTIGVAPSVRQSSSALGAYGGNLDCRHLRPGATLWLTAQVDGGLFFVGDVHASIGDGELCGTGVEIPAEVTLRIHHRRGWAPQLPLICDGSRVWVIGFGDTLDAAFDLAVRDILAAVESATGAERADVYFAVSALLEAEICQVVNPLRSVAISLRNGADRLIAAAGPQGATK